MGLGDTDKMTGQVKPSAIEVASFDDQVHAIRSIPMPLKMQERHEYDGSGQITYSGYAKPGIDTSDSYWMIFKYTWSDGNVTVKQVATGVAWDDRATVTYE